MALRPFGLAFLGWAGLLWAASASVSPAADLVLAKVPDAKAGDALKVEFDVTAMSDYIYRGVSLSERKPSVAGSVEARWHGFYAGTNVQSVDLPTQPASEVTWAAGYRWSRWEFDFDLGANYFWYPGEILADGAPSTSYWEYFFKVDRELIKDLLTVRTMLGYSPNVSGTGARGTYSEATFEIALPKLGDIEWQLNATVGYWRFGNVSPMLGGFPLPSYANWRVGLEFDFNDHVVFDVSYWDTNLSKEDCFVFTGDTMATPGGIPNAISNPDGLRSRLCGATLVGTLTMKFELSDLK
jgi:uncharacterized protein (TIGR02001 family)